MEEIKKLLLESFIAGQKNYEGQLYSMFGGGFQKPTFEEWFVEIEESLAKEIVKIQNDQFNTGFDTAKQSYEIEPALDCRL